MKKKFLTIKIRLFSEPFTLQIYTRINNNSLSIYSDKYPHNDKLNKI